MTDTGIVTDKAWEALSGVRLLALESNHDARMLEVGPYPYVIKQRIASARGHLSNDQAREALDNLAHENLRAVAAMHVSQENNTYRLPRETFEAVIAEHGLSTTVSVAFQNRLVTIG
jgi:phosphoribosyl 1,2-cyclic phosphodiesterase